MARTQADRMALTAVTLAGMEPLLATELRGMGAGNVREGVRAVHFEGDLGTVYKVNFRSQLALRVLRPLVSFHAKDEHDFYRQALKYAWEDIIAPGQTMAVRAVVFSEVFTHSGFMALKCKDAVVDRIRSRRGSRPDVSTEAPDVAVFVHINQQTCTLSLDSTGPSLHRRGYRDLTGQAPLNEVLAAGLVHLTDWQPHRPLVDGMCGSGTIAIEAGIRALQVPVGVFRQEPYAFERWPGFDPALLEAVTESCLKRILDSPVRILAYDMHPNAISKARHNIHSAEMGEAIQAMVGEFTQVEAPEGAGTVILNPPYGERMDKEDIQDLYKRLGDAFKQRWAGWSCFILSSNMEALKHVGLRASRRHIVFNGPLECRFVRYDMFSGPAKAAG